MQIIINQEYLKERHICWFVVPDKQFDGDYLRLCEVVERTYPHPDAPDVAVIPQIETKYIKSVRRTDSEAGALLLLEAVEKTTTHQFRSERARG